MTTNAVIGVCTAAKSSGLVTVKVGAQIVSAQCPRDLTVAAGDTVALLVIGSAYWVVQRYFTTATGGTDPSTAPEPPGAPTNVQGTSTFLPTKTASWRDTFGGWRTDNDSIYQGEYSGNGNHIGCAFYGGQVKTLVGKTVLSAYIKASRLSGGQFAAAATTLGHITESSKPSGMPTFGGSFTGPNLAVGATSTKIMIDTSLAQSLVDGTYGGLGIHISGSTPYIKLAGLSDYSGSFALTINWTRG
jgi:hypothetical protein